MEEQNLERRFVKGVKDLGGITVKNAFAGVKSLPDRSAYFPGGVCLFAEIKRPGKTVTEKQALMLKRFQALGFQCFVINSEETLQEFLQVAKFYAK